MVDTLRRNGFDAVHRVVVGPDRAKCRDVGCKARRSRSPWTSRPRRTRSSSWSTRAATPGCARGTSPRATRSSSGRVAVFEFVVPPAGAGSRDLGGPARRGGTGDGPVVCVAAALQRPRSGRSSSSSSRGWSTSPASTPPSGATSARSPTPASRRTGTAASCFFVHGTFDSTVGAFGALAATEAGRDFLTQALGDYDAVIGFDHRTLSVDPLENARELADRADAVPGATGDVGRRLPQPRRAHRTQLRRVRSAGSRLARQGRPGGLRRRHQRGDPLRGRDPLGGSGRPLHQPRGRQRAGDRRAARRSADRGSRRRSGARHRCAGPLAGLVRDRPGQRARHRRDGPGRAVRHRASTRTSAASPVRGHPGSSCRRTSR